jgi:hypothetical protein
MLEVILKDKVVEIVNLFLYSPPIHTIDDVVVM